VAETHAKIILAIASSERGDQSDAPRTWFDLSYHFVQAGRMIVCAVVGGAHHSCDPAKQVCAKSWIVVPESTGSW
jgi:hypothetical protein